MYPSKAFLIDELVKRQLQRLNQVEQATVFPGRTGRTLNISGTPRHVVGGWRPSNHGVELRAAVPAADVDRLAVGAPERIQHIKNQTTDI